MSHLHVLRELEARRLSLTVVGTDLRLQGPRDRIDPELVGRIKKYKADLLAHLAGPAGFALTELQHAYLVGRGDVLEMGGVASHIYHEIEGVWDIDRLESALRAVVARHGMLRTRFTADGTQVEQPSVDVRIERLDLRGAPDRDARRLALREQRAQRILPADRAPLLAATVTILADDRMVLHVDHDGLIMDATSMFLFFREWWNGYRGGPSGGAAEGPSGGPADEAEASFEPYVAAVAAARTKAPAQRSRAYWMDRLDDLAPHPDLPLRTSPSAIGRPRFTSHVVCLEAPAWAALKAHAARAGLTPSGLLLAAYAETLACWGAGSRFTLNTTVANRPPIHPRIAEAIGNFSETMLVEIEVDRRVTFRDRARAIQARLRRDLDNRHFSGIEVLRELTRRRGGAGPARMPYTFNSALGHGHGDLDGSVLELFGPEVHTASQTPQVWLNGFAFEQHGRIVVQFDEIDGLFPEGLIDAIVGGYRSLLHRLVDDDAWSATAFDLLPAEQRARRRAANDTARPLPATALAHDGFLARAARAPDAPAIVTSGAVLSYGEVLRRASHAAAWLRAERVGRDELVGLVMARGPEQIIGILATVLAGAAYLPIDAALPPERRDFVLADGRVRCVLTNTDGGGPAGAGRRVLRLDAAGPVPADAPAVPVAPGASPDDLAYVIYTSGTTGRPKGVMVSHRSVLNVVADCNSRFAVGPADRFFGISAFTFDLSVFDVFGALAAGAAIVLPDADGAADPAHWLRMCQTAGVTVWNSVPAIVSLLHDQAVTDGPSALARLRLVMMSGDRIPPALPAALRAVRPGLDVVSLGGPTETTVWNILHPVGADEVGRESIPYGRPNANNRAYVLDADGLDAPDWVTGEICAAGTGLARGYWGDPDRTAERFRHDARLGERIYRTGDLGRYLPTGEIDILGRRDFQIKVNGYRIEAGEVETRLVAIDGVRQAVVTRDEGVGGARLVAHLVPAGSDRPPEAVIRQKLRRHLPEYMVPSTVYWHDALPLTRNGKVDRSKLDVAATAAVPAAGGRGGPADAPDPDLERRVAELWANVLRMPDVDTARTFYELGGTSIAAARILTGVRKHFGVTITLDRLPEVETVRAMAAQISAARGDAEAAR